MMDACVFVFESVEDEDERVREPGGRVWAALLGSLSVAEGALASNGLWSAEEKSLFQFPDGRMGMQILAKSEMPPRFRGSKSMMAFAAANGISLLGRF